MRKITNKQRERDRRRSFQHRNSTRTRKPSLVFEGKFYKNGIPGWARTKKWVDNAIKDGLPARVNRRDKTVTITLPSAMNFSSHFKDTTSIMMAIRKLSNAPISRKAYRLGLVDFKNLKQISSSAALVLTAELSRWDDHCSSKLKQIGDWDTDIQERFIELGFFDLFENNPFKDRKAGSSSLIRHVRYIKGICGQPNHRGLKQSLKKIVGEDVSKYTFLRGGLDEAITNVGHHAYPDHEAIAIGKNWYLTGGYNTSTKDLKITFYDQGVGIPKTLPASNIWENVLDKLSIFPMARRMKDEVLLKAAMEFRRTKTKEHDRGKGLSDLLNFIIQRKEGYLSILSRHGLYKYSIENGKEREKSERLPLPIEGTLIIWKTHLN